jgi:class 3 adenylate cyclase
MADPLKRVLICSVLCLDIVEYSLYRVAEQLQLKQQLVSALEGIAGRDDVIVRDTGGGLVLSFLEDPELALLTAVRVRNAFAAQRAMTGPSAGVRCGIDLGQVALVKDVHGSPSVIGDAVNVARYIMIFSEPGQILVSRAYCDVMARLSDAHAGMFDYRGEKMDENARLHWVYAINDKMADVIRSRAGKKAEPIGGFAAWVRSLLR